MSQISQPMNYLRTVALAVFSRIPLLSWSLIYCLAVYPTSSPANELPDLGDSASAIVSPEQERRLGRAWLRQLRAQAPLIQDPVVFDYLYSLVYRLAAASDIQEPDIAMVIIDNSQINAFAVPGGVVGFNAGLLLAARSEAELGSVIAHELAHLSQRHYARGVERSQQTGLMSLAAVLASIALIAAGSGDAGLAALATSQAAAIDSQLRFSRANEQEADRIGMQTMIRAGIDPAAMADFFEALQRSQRFSGQLAPEFLQTHPVTESRITDARSRAAQITLPPKSDSLEFHLAKMRMEVHYTRNLSGKIQDLSKQLQEAGKSLEAVEYGLAYSYSESGQYDEALKQINALLEKRPNRITYLATKAEILMKSGRQDEAVSTLKTSLMFNPNNYVLSLLYSDSLIATGDYRTASSILRELTIAHPSWPEIWWLLAEAYGNNKQSLNAFQARAEYYFLTGRSQKALEQLRFAIPLADKDFQQSAIIQNRIREIEQSLKDLRT